MDVQELKSAIINMLGQTEDVDALNAAYMALYNRIQGSELSANAPSRNQKEGEDIYPMNSGMFNIRMQDPKEAGQE